MSVVSERSTQHEQQVQEPGTTGQGHEGTHNGVRKPRVKVDFAEEPEVDKNPRKGNDKVEIVEYGSESETSRTFSSPRIRTPTGDVATHRRPSPKSYVSRKRVTMFPFHPWATAETRTAGVVVWTPRTIEELLEMAVEQFGGSRSFILNSEGGEIRCVDLIAEGDKLYIVDSLEPSHIKNE